MEEYLLRMAINEESFSELIGKCLGAGKSKKTFDLVSQLRMMVRDLTLLHRVSFLMRQRFKDPVCRAPLDDHRNAFSYFAR